ncbi:MAG: DUF881 domain-containing protein [Marmoricola sp.]
MSAEHPGPPQPGAGLDPDSPAVMGLLTYLSAHALDDDYASVASRAAPTRGGSRSRARVVVVAVLAAFALLLVLAATQTSKGAAAEANENKTLINQIQNRRSALGADRERVHSLTRENRRLRNGVLDNPGLASGAGQRLALLGSLAGTTRVHGPGVRILVDNAPGRDNDSGAVLDTDLQQLANGLWQAGAEAIAINGQRLTSLTAIREAGNAITVNYRSLDRPYTVVAIGDPASMPARFADTRSGRMWLGLQHQVGLQFTMQTRGRVTIPAAPGQQLRFARTPREQHGAHHGQEDGT